ncbi:MAG: c-type cytochrome [Sideroxydans sp.]|nr:c-type cytochrome [Sideroxydans sp.]
MNHQARTPRSRVLATMIAGAFVLCCSTAVLAEEAVAVKADAEAAKKLAREDHCLRCHAVNKKKEGPTYHAIAYKYQGRADAEEKLIKHITSGEDRVKLTDGHEETHKFDTKTDPEQIRNLVRWILEQ